MERPGSDTHPLDLAVIGGGPAGTAAALEARRGGLRVRIWERDRFPRHKVCGEFVSSESLPLLRQEIPTALARGAIITRAEFISQGGRRYNFALPSPARGLSRFVMDEALWQATIRSGAETCEGTAIRRVGRRREELHDLSIQCPEFNGPSQVYVPTQPGPVSGRLWEIESTDGESRKARALLVACGRWWSLEGLSSPVEQHTTGPWLGAKAHFAGVASNNAVEVYFFPGGYCGLAPIEHGLMNACCLIHRNLARASGAGELSDFALWLNRVARHPALDSRLRGAVQASETIVTAPLRPARRRADHLGALFAGDAAGFLDPFTGDGISQALHAGRLAAEIVVRACAGDEASLSLVSGAYRRQLGQAVARSYCVAGLLRLLVRAPADVQQWAATLLSGFATRLITETRWRGKIGPPAQRL